MDISAYVVVHIRNAGSTNTMWKHFGRVKKYVSNEIYRQEFSENINGLYQINKNIFYTTFNE